jgi:hypothetical protein
VNYKSYYSSDAEHLADVVRHAGERLKGSIGKQFREGGQQMTATTEQTLTLIQLAFEQLALEREEQAVARQR